MSCTRLCDELSSPSSYAELKTIISQVTLENRASKTLFKGKYQVLLLENLLPWQKPIGQFFQTVLGICGVQQKNLKSASSVHNVDESHCESPLDDYGSPLPIVFEPLLNLESPPCSVAIIEQLAEKFHLYPLSEAVGRKLLMLCNLIAKECKLPYPVVTLCHGKNPKAVVIQGSFKNDKIVQVIVNSHGSVSSHDKIPKLSSVKQFHLAGFAPSCTIETSVYARYDLPVGSEDSSGLQSCKDVSVILECEWSNPEAVLESVSTDCSCYAKIKTISGEDYSGASEKYKEIKLIKVLRDSLDTGVIEWPNSETHENFMQRVEDFMKAETANLLKKHKAKPLPTDVDLAELLDIVVKGDYNDYDFTNKLWLILKDCSSSEDLKGAMTYIFEELSELMDPPFVHPKNVSTIALNIKNIKEKAFHWPTLTSHLALQYLLEIGIEKLKRDYVTLFAGLDLVPYDIIKYFLQPEITSHEAVSCLEKLHCVLELTIIGIKSLRLSKMLLCELVRNILKYYTSVPDIDLQHVFKFKIPASDYKQLLDKMRPTVWEISLLSADKDFKKQTVLHYSALPSVSPSYTQENYHPKFMLKDSSYTYMSGTLVEDGFFLK